ncbi:MAG: hypothetical protein ACREDM_11190 [Methylocella sp.]
MSRESELFEGAGMTPDEAAIAMLQEKLDWYAIALGYYAEPMNWGVGCGGSAPWRTLVSEPDTRDRPGWKVASDAMRKPRRRCE